MKSGVLREATNAGDVLEIPRRFNNYEVTEVIGTGGFAVVVGVLDRAKHRTLAAKVMRRPKANTKEMQLLERELRLCETVSCPFLVSCVDCVYLDNIIIVIMEKGEGQDLLTAILEKPRRVSGNWKTIFKQMCKGVQYLHSHGLAHRDLKPENIIIDDVFNCKLCDYGLLCESETNTLSTTKFGTVPYLSPEMFYSTTYSAHAADIWALGITLYVMLTGCIPWKSMSSAGIRQEIMNGVTDLELLGKDEVEMIKKCCDVNPETRPTIDEILANPALDATKFLRRNVSLPVARPPIGKANRASQLSMVKPCVAAAESVRKVDLSTRIGSQLKIPLPRRYTHRQIPRMGLPVLAVNVV